MIVIGFLKDLSGWLSGGKKKDTIRSVTVKLKVFNKRLMRQSRKLEMSAKLAKDKAVKLRKDGDIEGSKFHARNYLQVKNQARAVDNFRTNLEGLQFKLENAGAVKDVSEILKGVAVAVSGIKRSLSVPQITELMKNIDLDVEDFNVAQEITSESMTDMNLDTAVTDSQVDDFLGEIDAEIGVETGAALPSATGGSQKIKELEEELNRLKSSE
ncbi:MAG: Snf7 family protein [Candidatus Hermodarchaeota archaeon]